MENKNNKFPREKYYFLSSGVSTQGWDRNEREGKSKNGLNSHKFLIQAITVLLYL